MTADILAEAARRACAAAGPKTSANLPTLDGAFAARIAAAVARNQRVTLHLKHLMAMGEPDQAREYALKSCGGWIVTIAATRAMLADTEPLDPAEP